MTTTVQVIKENGLNTKLEIKKNKEKYNDQYKTENLKVNSFTEVKESGNQKEFYWEMVRNRGNL